MSDPDREVQRVLHTFDDTPDRAGERMVAQVVKARRNGRLSTRHARDLLAAWGV